MISNEQLHKLEQRISKLKSYLAIDKKRIEIANDEEKTGNPDFWNNPREAEVLMKELRSLKKWVIDYEQITSNYDDLVVLCDFFAEGEASEEEIENLHETTITLLENLEFKNMLSDEGDSLSAVLQITAGAGGTESCDWAEMLMRMYLMWSENSILSL